MNHGDLLYNRSSRWTTEDPRIALAEAGLKEALAVPADIGELTRLTEHYDPRVRSLALIGLFSMEKPEAFLAIQKLMDDQGETFPNQVTLSSRNDDPDAPELTEPRTVGQLAASMMGMVGFPGQRDQDFDTWKVGRIGNPEWIGWYDFLFRRATGGVSPLQPEFLPRVEALKKRMEATSPAVRAWFWFGVADDALMQPSYDTAMATEEIMFAAGEDLGSEALLAFLRDGSRAMLREPMVDDPQRGRRFILSNGGELFRQADAAALEEMGHLMTAADANPAMASRLIRYAITSAEGFTDNWDRARAVAALVDLRGNDETEFVVKWFYDLPVDNSHDSGQGAFFTELLRREPKQWRGSLRGIVANPEFESLADDEVRSTAQVVNRFSDEKVVPDEMMNDGLHYEIRNLLREYFGLPPVLHQRLERSATTAKEPLWSVGLENQVSGMALSPNGKMIALGWRDGGVRLFETASGRDLGTLEMKGWYPDIGFRKTDGHLLFVDSGKLTTWDVTEHRIVSEFKPDTGDWDECAFDSSGDLLASREIGGEASGIGVYDLPSGKQRWLFPMRMRAFGVISFSNDGNRLVASDEFTNDLHLFDPVSPTPIAKLTGHSGVPSGAGFSPDGRLLATLGGGKIMFWDARTGELRKQFLNRWAGGTVCFTPDSKEFITHSGFRQIARFDLATGEALSGYEIPTGSISKVLAAANGKHLFIVVGGASTNFLRGLQVKEGEQPASTRLECWMR